MHYPKSATIMMGNDMSGTVPENGDSQPVVIPNNGNFRSDAEFDDASPDKTVSRFDRRVDQRVHFAAVFLDDPRVQRSADQSPNNFLGQIAQQPADFRGDNPPALRFDMAPALGFRIGVARYRQEKGSPRHIVYAKGKIR
jgi:hypothetical protein